MCQNIRGDIQFVEDLFLPGPGIGIQQSAGGGDRIFRQGFTGQHHHESIRHEEDFCAVPEIFRVILMIRKELIDCVERHQLDPGLGVKFFFRQDLMDVIHCRHEAGIPVAVRLPDGLAVPEKDHVHAPGIDGEGADITVRRAGFFQPFLQLVGECGEIPVESAVFFIRMIGETVDFLQLQFAFFHPTDDRAPAGRAQVKCQMFAHDQPRLL